ncbi:MAG: 6-bladed beta-propeller [Gemmatimonadales bacterium]
MTLTEWRFVTDLKVGAGADDAEGLSQVKGLVVTQRGHIWVLEASTQDIRVFDSTGQRLRRIGRKGRGPGELLWPDGMAPGPDGTIWVHDPQNGRFSLFSESGDFLRQQMAPASGYAWVWTGGLDRTGRVWDQVFGNIEEGLPERLRRAPADWSRVDTLELPSCQPPGWKPEDAYYSKLLDGTRAARYSVTVPFYPVPVRAFEWATGAVWCAPSGAEYRLIKLDIERHDTLARITASALPVPVPPAERDSAVAALHKFLANMGEPDADWTRIPSVKPVVVGALVDDANRLWVRRGTVDTVSLFDIYSGAGQPLATVRIPFAISSWVAPVVRADRVWVVALDQDGVPFIVRGRFGP